jgi:hypothetical protein
MEMELIKTEKQLTRRPAKPEPALTNGIDTIEAIEVELNRLQSLFSAASFVLAEQDVHALSHLCSMLGKLKLNVANHFQKLKSISIITRKPVPGGRIKLNSILEDEISNLKIQVERFNCRLFKKAPVHRHML